jgi:hypothetical protein
VAAEQQRVRSAKVDARSKVALSLHNGLFASVQSRVSVRIYQLWSEKGRLEQEARAALEPFGVAAEQPRVRSARKRIVFLR